MVLMGLNISINQTFYSTSQYLIKVQNKVNLKSTIIQTNQMEIKTNLSKIKTQIKIQVLTLTEVLKRVNLLILIDRAIQESLTTVKKEVFKFKDRISEMLKYQFKLFNTHLKWLFLLDQTSKEPLYKRRIVNLNTRKTYLWKKEAEMLVPLEMTTQSQTSTLHILIYSELKEGSGTMTL